MLRQTMQLYTFHNVLFVITFQVAPIEDPLETSPRRLTLAIMIVLLSSQYL